MNASMTKACCINFFYVVPTSISLRVRNKKPNIKSSIKLLYQKHGDSKPHAYKDSLSTTTDPKSSQIQKVFVRISKDNGAWSTKHLKCGKPRVAINQLSKNSRLLTIGNSNNVKVLI